MTTIVSTEHARAIIESSDDAILSKDADAVITSWNPGAERLYGYTPQEAVGRPISILIPPHRANEERHILDRVLAGNRVDHYETERVRKDGEMVVVSLTVSPMRSATGEITGASVIARDITEMRRINERAVRLQRLTEALSREVSSERVAELIADEAAPAVGADAATVAMLEEGGEELRLIASRGYSERVGQWSSFPVAAGLPMAAAVRTGEPVWSSSAEDAKARFSDLARTEFSFESLAVVPLLADGRAFGAVAFSFRDRREFSQDERAFMGATAQQAANALERTRLHEGERRARERLGFIARASEFLGASLDSDEILQTLASVAVPEIADVCIIHLVGERGIHPLTISHADPARVGLVRELQERYPPDPLAPRGVGAVIRNGVPELHSTIDDALLVSAARDEEHLRLLRELELRSAMIVPLVAHARTLGAISFIAAESGRRFNDEDLSFAHELARHAALAIDNANRFRREHEAALTLQRALLPQRLPEVEGVELAARYLPAGPDTEAGGDWYDAIDLGDGRVDVVIGDVSGRGIPAASIMGQLRTAVGAYAVDRMDPDEIADRLDRLLGGIGGDEIATMLIVRLDPATGAASYVRAGHLPALVRDSSGSVKALDFAGSAPLGAEVETDRPCERTELAPGSLLLLYTDGLVERRGEVIDKGIERLQRIFAECGDDLEDCLDAIVDGMKSAAAADDTAALLVRLGGSVGSHG